MAGDDMELPEPSTSELDVSVQPKEDATAQQEGVKSDAPATKSKSALCASIEKMKSNSYYYCWKTDKPNSELRFRRISSWKRNLICVIALQTIQMSNLDWSAKRLWKKHCVVL